jgi:hypothetical protein
MPRSSMSRAVFGTTSGSDTPQSALESTKMRSSTSPFGIDRFGLALADE